MEYILSALKMGYIYIIYIYILYFNEMDNQLMDNQLNISVGCVWQCGMPCTVYAKRCKKITEELTRP